MNTNLVIAILLSAYTCIGWGMLAPNIRLLQRELESLYHPLFPLLLNALWTGIFSLIMVLAYALKGEPVTFIPVSKTANLLGIFWASGGTAAALAFMFTPAHSSLLNAIQASYPATVTVIGLWLYGFEALSPIKFVAMGLVLAGLILWAYF